MTNVGGATRLGNTTRPRNIRNNYTIMWLSYLQNCTSAEGVTDLGSNTKRNNKIKPVTTCAKCLPTEKSNWVWKRTMSVSGTRELFGEGIKRISQATWTHGYQKRL